MKTKTLKLIGYYITGTADLTLWGGGNASIDMKPIKVDKLPEDLQELKSELNDNGFGVQEINGAIIDIYEYYEHDVKILIEQDDMLVIGNVSDETIENYYSL
jgi:hypothetical protein